MRALRSCIKQSGLCRAPWGVGHICKARDLALQMEGVLPSVNNHRRTEAPSEASRPVSIWLVSVLSP